MRAWWSRTHEQVRGEFDEQTMGGLLYEFYLESANELETLRSLLREGHNADTVKRISEIERMFDDEERLENLDEEQSLDNWSIARKTGDSLIDRWEAQIARGETPDLEETK